MITILYTHSTSKPCKLSIYSCPIEWLNTNHNLIPLNCIFPLYGITSLGSDPNPSHRSSPEIQLRDSQGSRGTPKRGALTTNLSWAFPFSVASPLVLCRGVRIGMTHGGVHRFLSIMSCLSE